VASVNAAFLAPSKISSETYKTNPWFKDYYEHIYECTLNRVNSPNPCPTKLNGIPRAVKYIQDPYVLYVVNAVFSAALGAHEALMHSCRTDYFGVCNIFVTSGLGPNKIRFRQASLYILFFWDSWSMKRGLYNINKKKKDCIIVDCITYIF
jgi:hypothetical protein